MLALTEDLEVQASEVVGFLEADEPFVRALARLYCRRLLEFVRRGLRQEYLPQADVLSHVRGKVDWPARARLAVTQRLDFPCRFDDRSEDTPLNRTLKAALLEAEEILRRFGSRRRRDELRHAMGEVSDSFPGPFSSRGYIRTG